jgi:hypothetical protein
MLRVSWSLSPFVKILYLEFKFQFSPSMILPRLSGASYGVCPNCDHIQVRQCTIIPRVPKGGETRPLNDAFSQEEVVAWEERLPIRAARFRVVYGKKIDSQGSGHVLY